MRVHFICRGNAFRSFIAEAYLRSKNLPGIDVISSGTVAAKERHRCVQENALIVEMLGAKGIAQYAKSSFGDQFTAERLEPNDVAICMNPLVFEEASKLAELPKNTQVWNVQDFGEGRAEPKSNDEWLSSLSAAYDEITRKVDNLIAEQLKH